jgi:hypothetical protein
MPDEDITSTILRAAIYARISEDPRGLEHGVSRQLADCKKLAAASSSHFDLGHFGDWANSQTHTWGTAKDVDNYRSLS